MWDGANSHNKKIFDLVKSGKAIPVCPEQLGGLSTPRSPCETKGNKVVSINGENRTQEFNKGAKEALAIAKAFDCKVAILKSKSPSCGSNLIYDGTFSHKLKKGDGITTKLFKKNGIKIISEKEYI